MIIYLLYFVIITSYLQYFVTTQSNFTSISFNNFGNISCEQEVHYKNNQHPWLVYLAIENKDNTTTPCSGVLLTPRTVLTSAACLENAKPNNWKVYGHLTNSNYTSHHVRTFYLHPFYFKNSACDLAVVGLKEEIFGNNADMDYAGTDEGLGIPNEVDIFPLQQWHSCQITGIKEIKNITADPSKKYLTIQSITGNLMTKCKEKAQSVKFYNDMYRQCMNYKKNFQKISELENTCFSNITALNGNKFHGAGVVCHSSTSGKSVLLGVVKQNQNHLGSSDPLEITLLTKSNFEWIFLQMMTNFVAGRFSEEEVTFDPELFAPEKVAERSKNFD